MAVILGITAFYHDSAATLVVDGRFADKLAEPRGCEQSLLKDFVYFLLHSKKWWLIPLLVVLLPMGLLMFLSTSALAPFIYT